MCIFQPKKWHWHAVAMTENAFYAPKRFIISPLKKCVGPLEAKLTKHLHKNCMKTDKAGSQLAYNVKIQGLKKEHCTHERMRERYGVE